jgi:hypothetical protein
MNNGKGKNGIWNSTTGICFGSRERPGLTGMPDRCYLILYMDMRLAKERMV